MKPSDWLRRLAARGRSKRRLGADTDHRISSIACWRAPASLTRSVTNTPGSWLRYYWPLLLRPICNVFSLQKSYWPCAQAISSPAFSDFKIIFRWVHYKELVVRQVRSCNNHVCENPPVRLFLLESLIWLGKMAEWYCSYCVGLRIRAFWVDFRTVKLRKLLASQAFE